MNDPASGRNGWVHFIVGKGTNFISKNQTRGMLEDALVLLNLTEI